MIASVDESVGRVVATLDKLKLTDNTLIIFSSDNGGVGGYEAAGLSRNGVTDNAPLKGGKGMLYEGGIRVPYIFSWKGKIAPGITNETPIMGIDLYPTFVELAHAEAPPNYPLDGVSLMPAANRCCSKHSAAAASPGIFPATWVSAKANGAPRRPPQFASAIGS